MKTLGSIFCPAVPALIALAVTAIASGTPAAAAQPPAREKLDCHGGDITITGEHRTIELANCAVIRVAGSHNDISGVLPKHSKVFVTGDGNKVSLQPANGVSSSHLKDTGKDNRFNGPDAAPQGGPGPGA